MKKKLLLFMIFLFLAAVQIFAYSEKGWLNDVKKLTGPLTEEELDLAVYTRDYILNSWDKELKDLNKEEYDELVLRCASCSQNDEMLGLMKLGKVGEKGLKALIVVSEDIANNVGNFIDEKSKEYDKRHGDTNER